MFDIHFLRPQAFLFLVPAIALYCLGRFHSGQQLSWRRLIDPALLKAMTLDTTSRRMLTPQGLSLCMSLIWVLAISGPTTGLSPSALGEREQKLLVLFELDGSMLTDDLVPNRLVQAKLKLRSLIETLPNTEVALVVFAGSSHRILPYTKDHSALLHYLETLHPSMMPKPGHALSDALAFVNAEQVNQRGLLLISDGDAPGLLPEKPLDHAVLWLMGGELARASVDRSLYARAGFLVVDQEVGTGDIQRLQDVFYTNWHALDEASEDQYLDLGYYFLMPLLLLMLYWFRPGMVITWEAL